MASTQDAGFVPYAGQLVKSGIGTDLPYVNLEEGIVKSNLAKIHGLMPKIKDVFIRETRVFTNPLDPYITKFGERFGAAIEQAAFKKGAPDKKLDGTCMPWGDPEIAAQVNAANFAYNVEVSIRDHEIDKAVLDEGQLAAYTAQKMRTAAQTVALMKYRAWMQLVSDVTDGTRTIASYTDSSDPASTAVTYSPTVTGYCKSINKSGIYIPEVVRGSQVSVPDAESALTIANSLKDMAADFGFSGSDLNNLGIETFATGTPLLIMEKKVLNALDRVFSETNLKTGQSTYGYAGFPTVSFRQYASEFAEIVEVDSFAALPTNTTYKDMRLGAVLMDRDMLMENVQYADVESFRCTKERATGYDYQGSSTLSIWQGLDSHALLFSTKEPSP